MAGLSVDVMSALVSSSIRAARATRRVGRYGLSLRNDSTQLLAGGVMLQLRPNCECCDRDLPPDSPGARICSFECTFCEACAEGILRGRFPNCGGELVRRPIRPAAALAKHPASTARVVRRGPCATAG